MNRSKLIAIAGGIGSGKSVVARMLQAMGYQVYDCDLQARKLIDGSHGIKCAIAEAIGPQSIADDGSLDRSYVSSIVFSDKEKLLKLNSITHSAVRDDLHRWRHNGGALRFVETAILYQSGIDRMVDAVIEVTAPAETRIERITARNNIGRQHALARINSQHYDAAEPHPFVYSIINDDRHAILPQLLDILPKL